MNDGDDDGLNDMGRERVMDENGEGERVVYCSVPFGFLWVSKQPWG